MSDVMKALRDSTDPLDNDLARVLDHWQAMKRSQNLPASLGYEPRDIAASGAAAVISSRVLKAAAGFEEVDPEQSYEALVLKYGSDRFEQHVIAAAQARLKFGASKLEALRKQDIQIFVKSSAYELFGEVGVQPSVEDWGRHATLPKASKMDAYVDEVLIHGVCSFVWLHEQPRGGEPAHGLTALVQFGPMGADRRAEVLDAFFFPHPVGKELLAAHVEDGSFISAIGAYRLSRIWPVSNSDVDELLSAVRAKASMIAEYEGQDPDPHDPLNLEPIEDETTLRQAVLRRGQSAFRKSLLSKRPNSCAFTGTTELSVLEAAHIIPYAQRFADRDKPENGLLLRSDIHKLFDAHLISINPETRTIEVSDRIASPDYQGLHGKIVVDEVSWESLGFHFENYRKTQA